MTSIFPSKVFFFKHIFHEKNLLNLENFFCLFFSHQNHLPLHLYSCIKNDLSDSTFQIQQCPLCCLSKLCLKKSMIPKFFKAVSGEISSPKKHLMSPLLQEETLKAL